MKTIILFLLLVAGQLASSASALASPAKDGKFLVKFRSEISIRDAEVALDKVGLKIKRHIKEVDLYVAETVGPIDVKEAIKSGLYLYIEPNYIWHAISVPANTPNDPLFPDQLELQRLQIEAAWNHSTGSSGSNAVVVAVVDTGVDMSHSDLKNQIWTNPREIPGNGIDDDGNGFVDDVNGWDFSGNDSFPLDENMHGTHVSGIIGAEGGNGIGTVGVNWSVSIMPVRFLDKNGQGTTELAIDAIVYASKNGARVINASWGGSDNSLALRDAINYAYQNGTLTVCAAGNGSADTDQNPQYPSAYDSPGIISVASSAANGVLSGFSNSGQRTVDLAAPGSDVLSTLPGEKWGRLSGTSMATPMVVGVAALALSKEPTLSALQLRNLVLNSIDERSTYLGVLATAGDLNADKAMTALEDEFQIWPSRMTVAVGSVFEFSTYRADGQVSWQVSDPSLASIDTNGALTILKEGSFQVTAQDSAAHKATTLWVRSVPKASSVTGGCHWRSKKNSMKFWEKQGAVVSLGLPFFVGFLVTRRRRYSSEV